MKEIIENRKIKSDFKIKGDKKPGSQWSYVQSSAGYPKRYLSCTKVNMIQCFLHKWTPIKRPTSIQRPLFKVPNMWSKGNSTSIKQPTCIQRPLFKVQNIWNKGNSTSSSGQSLFNCHFYKSQGWLIINGKKCFCSTYDFMLDTEVQHEITHLNCLFLSNNLHLQPTNIAFVFLNIFILLLKQLFECVKINKNALKTFYFNVVHLFIRTLIYSFICFLFSHLFVYLFIFFAILFIYLFIYVYLFIYLLIYSIVYLFIHLFIYVLFIYLFIYLLLHLFIYSFIYSFGHTYYNSGHSIHSFLWIRASYVVLPLWRSSYRITWQSALSLWCFFTTSSKVLVSFSTIQCFKNADNTWKQL